MAKVTAAQEAKDPALPELQRQHAILKAQRDLLFQGETTRGLLLTSFGFSELGAKGDQAATAAYGIAIGLALVSIASLAVAGKRSAEPAPAITVEPARPQLAGG